MSVFTYTHYLYNNRLGSNFFNIVETMAKFLIEVPHNEDELACMRAIESFVQSGNHFLAHAEWGCEDNEQLNFH